MFWALLLALNIQAEPQLLLEALQKIDKNLSSTESQLKQVDNERQNVQAELAAVAAKLAIARIDTTKSQRLFQKRLSFISRQPASTKLFLLADATSIRDYLQTRRILHQIASHDLKLHKNYLSKMQQLELLEKKLAQHRQELAELTKELQTKRQYMAKERRAHFSSLSKSLKSKNFKKPTAELRHLARLYQRQTPDGQQHQRFKFNRKRLPWPTMGEVVVKFGEQIDRQQGAKVKHQGIDIQTAPGSDVFAIAGGKVLFANWLRGFGQVVIIEHGEGYHSVMGHLDKIFVPENKNIEAGTKIGEVGNTGSLRGTILYFEIRSQGRPVDPLLWLRK